MLNKPVSSLRPLAAVLLFVFTGCGGDTAPVSPTAPTGPAFQLTGRVIDASAGISVSGVTVALDGVNAGRQATTGGDGRYTLTNVLGGSFTLRAQHTGYLEFVQDVTVTSHTTIDLRMIPTRSLNSGWSGGQFTVTLGGERLSTRLTNAQVTANLPNVSGRFTGADGTSGTFTGRLFGSQFAGSIGVEIASGSRRCRASAGNVTGTATGDNVTLAAATAALETCGGTATDLELTLTP